MAAHDHDHEHDEEHEDVELTEAEAQAEAERLVRKEIALSQIRQYGDPVLRMRAEEVEEFDDELRAVTERMIGVMHDAEGVGLAATQVGILRRFFVCTIDGEDRVLVNPSVTALGDDTSDSAQRFATETLSATSLDVIREYAQAMQALSNSKFDEARQNFGEAVKLDPNFGLAYAGMAIASANMGQPQEAATYVQEAIRHVEIMEFLLEAVGMKDHRA